MIINVEHTLINIKLKRFLKIFKIDVLGNIIKVTITFNQIMSNNE